MKTFEKILVPVLRHDGFEGLYLNKAGSTQVPLGDDSLLRKQRNTSSFIAFGSVGEDSCKTRARYT